MIYRSKGVCLIVFICCCFSLLSQNPYDVSSKTAGMPAPEVQRSSFAQKFKYIHPADWKPGMAFIVPPSGSSMSFTKLYLRHYKVPSREGLDREGFKWKKFTLEKIEEREGIRHTWTFLVFRNDTSLYEHVYRSGGIEKLRNDPLPLSIYGLVWLDEIDQVKKELEGKYVYVLTPLWMQDTEQAVEIPYVGEQFVKVKVTAVGCGNEDTPVKVVFETPSGVKAHQSVYLSGTNRQNTVLTGKHFDEVFSLSDPKLKYPNISAATWRSIQQLKVKIGMTEKECILSWGLPDDVNTNISSFGASEQWVYDNSYLYFKGKKLVHIQN